MAELLTKEQFCERLPLPRIPVIQSFILCFERDAAPWAAPRMALARNKDGVVVMRKGKDGKHHPVTVTFKGQGQGDREKQWQYELHHAFQELGLPWCDKETQALRVSIWVVYERPKSRPKTKRLGMQPRAAKPDIVNIRKAIEDAIEGALCDDDASIFAGITQKWEGAAGQRPCTIIRIDYVPRWIEDQGEAADV